MNNPNKYKPLSSEELFQLLDKQSNTEINFDGMDDFEREALEGFTENVNTEKAKALTQEVNTAISKKVSEGNGGQKNKIIWFSAAASIVLIIIVSVFFLNQSRDESNIALNDVKEDTKHAVTQIELPAPPEAISNNIANSTLESNGKAESKLFKSSETTKNKTQQPIEAKELESGAKEPGSNKQALAEAKPTYGGVTKNSKDFSKEGDLSSMENDEANKQTMVLADKLVANKKEEISREESEKANDVSIAQNAAPISAASGYAQQDNQKADMDSKSAERTVKEKAKKSASDDANGLITVSKTSPAASVSAEQVQIKGAFYNGGELAIKQYVIDYFKEKNITVSLKGKFKITGTVNTLGVLNVTSLIQITKEYCGCEEQIKSALNTMKNWSPASSGGKSSSARVEFTLVF